MASRAKFTRHQRRLFALSYAVYGNIEKAALAAGVAPERALEDGWLLFRSQIVQKQIDTFCRVLQEDTDKRVQSGLTSIAYDENRSDMSRIAALKELHQIDNEKKQNNNASYASSFFDMLKQAYDELQNHMDDDDWEDSPT